MGDIYDYMKESLADQALAEDSKQLLKLRDAEIVELKAERDSLRAELERLGAFETQTDETAVNKDLGVGRFYRRALTDGTHIAGQVTVVVERVRLGLSPNYHVEEAVAGPDGGLILQERYNMDLTAAVAVNEMDLQPTEWPW